MNRKTLDLFFVALHLPLDFLLIILAGVSSYTLRFQEFIVDIRPAVYGISFNSFILLLVYLSLFMVLIFSISGVYKISKRTSFIEDIIKLFNTTSFALMFLIVFIFFKREFFNSRFIILAGFVFIVIYLSFARAILRKIKHFLYKKGIGVSNVILVGIGKNFSEIKEALALNYKLGYRMVETVTSFEEFEIFYNKYGGNIDEVLQINSHQKEENLKFLNFCEQNHVIFKYVADIFDARTINMENDTLAGIPIIEIKKTKLDGWGRISKRLFDVGASFLAIIFFSPIMLIIGVLIKLDSRGPVIYKNKRLGQNAKEFNTLKFRSMYYEMSTGVGNGDQQKKALELESKLIQTNNVRDGAIYKIKDDPRVTKIGHFIRKTSLDELPQFFNVLMGNMSLVGPRPHQQREVERYKKEHLRVLDIKPGITGIAQVSGRSDLNYEDELKLDLYYIDNWSFVDDLKIIFKTPFSVLARRKAE